MGSRNDWLCESTRWKKKELRGMQLRPYLSTLATSSLSAKIATNSQKVQSNRTGFFYNTSHCITRQQHPTTNTASLRFLDVRINHDRAPPHYLSTTCPD